MEWNLDRDCCSKSTFDEKPLFILERIKQTFLVSDDGHLSGAVFDFRAPSPFDARDFLGRAFGYGSFYPLFFFGPPVANVKFETRDFHPANPLMAFPVAGFGESSSPVFTPSVAGPN